MIYYFDCYVGVFFVFDEDDCIIYKGGKIWYFLGGYFNFGDNIFCVFYFDVYDFVKFYFGDFNGIEIFLYLNLNFSGMWKVVKVYINLKVIYIFI